MKALLKLMSPVPLVTLSAGGLAFLAYWAGYKLRLPWYAIAAIVAAIFVIWLLVLWILRLRAAKAGAALEKSIEAQAQRQVASSRPGREKDIEALKNQLLEAIAALKASRVGKGKKGPGALYVLPWYMIIGPPAAGKTTLLQNSGLNFPYLDPARSRSSVRGVGGTRNCDWWFADSAVILDTAGRYVLPVEADDTQEWLGFLDLLRKYRGRKPLNGLFVGVSIQDLVTGTEEDLENHALKIRGRIDELIKQLGITFPVYVVFTKCDLIRGFVEFYGELSRNERAQVWGSTVARERSAREPAWRIFEEEMDRLVDSLASAKVQRLAQLTQPEARPEVLFFPLQFEALKPRLSRFFETLFKANPYQELPIFRGFYFTSGTQEGRPIDQVINAMLKGFGVADVGGGEMVVEPSQTKSYFIEDVFSKIAFPDRHLAGPSAQGERRSRALRMKSFLAGSAVVALFFVLLMGLSLVNHGLVFETRTISRRALLSVSEEGSWLKLDDLKTLDKLRGKLAQMDARHRPLAKAAFLGTFQGERTAGEARRALVVALREGAMRPAIPFLGQKLRQGGAGPTPDFHRYYVWYRTWLLLQDPAELLRTSADAAQTADALTDYWSTVDGSGSAAEYRRLMTAQLEYASRYPAILAELFDTRARIDQTVAGIAVARIRRDWSGEGLYPGLLAAGAGSRPVLLDSLSGKDPSLVGSTQVPGTFSAEGWKGPVRAYVDWVGATQKDWALRDAWSSDPPDRRAEVIGRYAQDYERHWIDFLRGVGIRPGADDTETLVFLERASASEKSPVLNVLRGVAANTQFGKDGDPGLRPIEESFQVVDEFVRPVAKGSLVQLVKVKVMPGEEKKPPLQSYLERVAALKESYTDIAKSGDPGRAKQVLDVESWVKDHIDPTSAPVEAELARLLTLPSQAVSKKVLSMKGAAVESQWENVYQEFRQTLAGRYPLRRDAEESVALSDFEAFFGPNGSFASFYKQTLAGVVSEDGSRLLVPNAGLSSEFLSCLGRAYRIRRAFFPGGDQAGFRLSLKTEAPDRPAGSGITFFASRLEIGGRSFAYKSGPPLSGQLSWPGEMPEAGASLTLDLRGSASARPVAAEGVWGFFRLLDKARVSSSSGAATIRWTVPTEKGDLQIVYEATGLPAVHPLEPGLLRFSCPERIGNAP